MKKLCKSTTDKKITGVCGGLGVYLDVDPTVIRVLFLISLFITFSTTGIIYLILALILPDDTEIID